MFCGNGEAVPDEAAALTEAVLAAEVLWAAAALEEEAVLAVVPGAAAEAEAAAALAVHGNVRGKRAGILNSVRVTSRGSVKGFPCAPRQGRL
jgi:hypothetical protein